MLVNSYNGWLRVNSSKTDYQKSMELLSEVQSVLAQQSLQEIIMVRSEILTAILAAKVRIKNNHHLGTLTKVNQEVL